MIRPAFPGTSSPRRLGSGSRGVVTQLVTHSAAKGPFRDRKGPLTWEPHVGMEPTTYSLRVRVKAIRRRPPRYVRPAKTAGGVPRRADVHPAYMRRNETTFETALTALLVALACLLARSFDQGSPASARRHDSRSTAVDGEQAEGRLGQGGHGSGAVAADGPAGHPRARRCRAGTPLTRTTRDPGPEVVSTIKGEGPVVGVHRRKRRDGR